MQHKFQAIKEHAIMQPMSNEFYEQYGLKQYYKYLGARSRKAVEERAKRGESTCAAPTGYRNVETPERKRIEIDPQLGPLVKEAFEQAAKVRTSLRNILADLTPKGLVSRNGTPLGASAFRNMLTNPFYAGILRYGGTLHQGNHVALVSPQLFVTVQQRLRDRRKRSVD